MLPEVHLLREALLRREGILAAAPGRRLKGVAFAPELQVWHTLCNAFISISANARQIWRLDVVIWRG